MPDWNDLTPADQRRVLANQMRITRTCDLMARSHTAEALAQSRELLAVPVYSAPSLDTQAEPGRETPQRERE